MRCDSVNDKENDVSGSNATNGKENWARLVYEGAYSVRPRRGLECGRAM